MSKELYVISVLQIDPIVLGGPLVNTILSSLSEQL